METIIKAGNLVIPYGRITRADIHVKGEKIFAISESIGDLLIHTFIWAIHFLS
jgi:dihydroorotase-like cyclic amidohydrolase